MLVHHRRPAETRACLAALRRDGDLPVYVVDTGGRGEARRAAAGTGGAHVLEPGHNLGWAGGANLGIEAALADGARAVLLVNPDAQVRPGCVAALLAAAGRPGAGLATGKILLPAAPGRRPAVWAAGGALRPWRGLAVNLGQDLPDGPRFDRPAWVDFGSGCLLLVRREVFERVGLLEPRYFLYMEDVEFCLRARRAGFATVYEPRAVCVHRPHGSVGGAHGDPGPVLDYYLTRNRFLFARAELGGARRVGALGWLVTTRPLKAAAAALRGRPARAALLLRASWDGLCGRDGRTFPVEGEASRGP